VTRRRPQSPCRHGVTLIACVALVLPLSLLCAPAAIAAGVSEGNSFNELTKNQPETTATATSTQSGGTSSYSNSSTLLFAGGAVAVVLLAGIAFIIVRDARRVAPAGDADLIDARSRSDSAARVRRRRAQAKAARRQRKRNR
jgi:hypothetical protein